MTFSQRITRIKPSATLAAAARATAMIAQGIDVINFGVGEPDFDTPAHIKQACHEALDRGVTKYGPVAGFPALRTAVCEKLLRENALTYAPEEILITPGAKAAILAALQVLLDPGDEVIIPAPYWVSYADQVLLSDGAPVVVATQEKNNFQLTPGELTRAITPRTRMLIINSPCNPTGVVYSATALQSLGRVCAEKNLWVITDEIYEALVYAPAIFASFATNNPHLRDRTILINGFSKTYAMTGWRLGYAAAPKSVIAQMNTWQSQVVTCATTFAQQGGIAAYTESQADVAHMRATFATRRDLIMKSLRAIPDLRCVESTGAFYAFPNVSAYLGKKFNGQPMTTSSELADYLLNEARIAVVAGEGFGAPGFLRFSYALSTEALQTGLDRFAQALQKLE